MTMVNVTEPPLKGGRGGGAVEMAVSSISSITDLVIADLVRLKHQPKRLQRNIKKTVSVKPLSHSLSLMDNFVLKIPAVSLT